MDDERRCLTYSIREAATLLGCSVAHAYDFVREDAFPVRVIRLGRRIVVPAKALDALLGGLEVGLSPAA